MASTKHPAGKARTKAKRPSRPVARHASQRSPPKKVPPPKKTVPAKPARAAAPAPAVAPAAPASTPAIGSQRRHVLSLAFVRDGEEFFARLETNGGQISEFKNRALDQLLTLVASELEDLLE